MRSFFKIVFASMFGFFIASFLVFLLFVGIIAAVSSQFTQKADVTVTPNSVLHLRLDYPIEERSKKDPFENFDFITFEKNENAGLSELLKAIQQAKADDNIKGIYLHAGSVPSGFATVDAIRQSLLDFKSSGKFIIAYGELISQKSYYLASVADKVYLNPKGFMEWSGLMTELLFLKGTLDKLGVEPQIFYAGKFKSATEPFRLDKMSEENRLQIKALQRDLYAYMLNHIAESRKIPVAQLDSLASNFVIQDAELAAKFKLVDGLLYQDAVLNELKEKTGKKEDEKLASISVSDYISSDEEELKKGLKMDSGKDKVAVLYATGNIIDGKGGEDEIASENYVKAIRKIKEDKTVKALVLRVNSGGGSALASEVILHELEEINKKMPVIASMGDVAASGGYYICAGADTILAEHTTITGSIGVFGIIPNMKEFFNEKLGFTFDTEKTGKYSDMTTVTRPLTNEEKAIIQKGVDKVYIDFKGRVAEGRNMTIEKVDSLGQGRIWTGKQAVDNGLVDILGGLDQAVKIAAAKAGISDFEVTEFPTQKNPFELIMNGESEELKDEVATRYFGEEYALYKKVQEIKNLKGVQARMPFEVEVK